MTISDCTCYWKSARYLSRDAVHLAEDGREKRALSATDGSDNCGQATLLDGQVDVVYEGHGLLGAFVNGRSRCVVLLGPLERPVGDTNGIGIDWVGIRGNRGSLRSHQERVDAAPGSRSNGTSAERQIENTAFKETRDGHT